MSSSSSSVDLDKKIVKNRSSFIICLEILIFAKLYAYNGWKSNSVALKTLCNHLNPANTVPNISHNRQRFNVIFCCLHAVTQHFVYTWRDIVLV